jgi:hypothetical protein
LNFAIYHPTANNQITFYATNIMKNIIVHYHVFKNAGSTVDYILKNNFYNAWAAYEGEKATSKITPQELANFIGHNPQIIAISSHHAIFPAPQIDGIRILPILFLRHPLDRVRSIYEFERRQGQEVGPISKGAEHAAKLPFSEYIKWRLDSSANGVIHNHQTTWLLHHPRFNRLKIQESDYNLARQTLTALPFFGLVERFDDSLGLMSYTLSKIGIKLDTSYQVMNSSSKSEKPLELRLALMREAVGEGAWADLIERNRWDLMLYDRATTIFQEVYSNHLVKCGENEESI